MKIRAFKLQLVLQTEFSQKEVPQDRQSLITSRFLGSCRAGLYDLKLCAMPEVGLDYSTPSRHPVLGIEKTLCSYSQFIIQGLG